MKDSPRSSDRYLGEEWLDWNGHSEENIESSKTPFVVLSSLVIFIFIGTILLFRWLIYPRLLQGGELLAQTISIILSSFSIILGLWLVVFILALNSGATAFSLFSRRPKFLIFLLNWAARLGKIFGFSRDRLSNSFLKVNNLLTFSLQGKVVPEKLLVLLPRCLTREIIGQLQELKEKYRFEMHTVGGGSAARQIVYSKNPQAIVAIACERDLVSGIKDVSPYIPVLGFPNFRPKGPCKNTQVDIPKIETAIKFFLKQV